MGKTTRERRKIGKGIRNEEERGDRWRSSGKAGRSRTGVNKVAIPPRK